MRTKCISHPASAPLMVVHQWQVDTFNGDTTAAKLISFFEYWHGVKLAHAEQITVPIDYNPLIQHHTEAEIEAGVLLDVGRKRIRKALERLYEAGVLTREKNPHNPHDRTRHFLFWPEIAQKLADEWNEVFQAHRQKWAAKRPICIPKNLAVSTSGQNAFCKRSESLVQEGNKAECKRSFDLDPKTTSKITNDLNTPLTPQGGNGAIASENFQDSERAEQTGEQQNPTRQKEAKNSGSKRAAKSTARAAKRQQTSEQILALLPEDMQGRFDKFWRGYSAFCDERQAKAGPKKQAAVAWKFLVESNFNGRGFEAYEDGVRKFLRQQGDRTAGIPHASRFLYSTANGSGAWEDALEQATSKGSVSDLAGGVSDRGSSPRIVTAADFEFSGASPPPAHIKAQIAQMRGMTVA